MKNLPVLWLIGLVLLPSLAQAIDEKEVRKKLHTVYGLYLTPFEAYNMKQKQGDKVLLVDVRARSELKYVGATPLIDANIPAEFQEAHFG